MPEKTTSAPVLTDDDVQALLRAVGAPAGVTAGDHGRSFEELGLDSLARFEIASRIKRRYGVDIEDDITAETSPAGVRDLVNGRLAGA
ncbi:acyl carrier protein [Actinomadura keratinilytica]|jgi:acyl carrier protein|uniref:Carrier domain-containing protein n=1 Tax=Actinomadura keratinilytica TaxID=547461 RepID=A0ABP6UJD6_9ACTN